jgi:hypothetical protein
MSGTFIFSINQKVKFIYSCDRRKWVFMPNTKYSQFFWKNNNFVAECVGRHYCSLYGEFETNNDLVFKCA